MNNKDIQIVYKDINEVTPYINNPRDNEAAVDKVAASIAEFGFKVPIVIDKDNVIVTGHTRRLAALKLGLKDIPCIYADDLTPAQIKAFRIADNKTSEFASWDDEMLRVELEALKELDVDLKQTAFDEWELDNLLNPIDEETFSGFFEPTEPTSTEKEPKKNTMPTLR